MSIVLLIAKGEDPKPGRFCTIVWLVVPLVAMMFVSIGIAQGTWLSGGEEVERDADRKILPAYVAIEFRAKDLAVGDLAGLPRLLREKATRMQEKINQLTAGTREVTIYGGIIRE